LTNFGYRVITATDGDDAQALAVTCDGPIHLIVSDVVMPGAAGPEVVARLRDLLPDEPRVLFMSGYTEHALLRSDVTETRVHFLHKPFLPVTLLQRVREVLDAR
jgi:CheY-like chemotaxis protein